VVLLLQVFFLRPSSWLKTEWLLTAFNPQDALLQKIIFADILDAKWQAYRAEETVKNQLARAGFVEIKIFMIRRIFSLPLLQANQN